MTTPKDLLNILEDLSLDQFEEFKWFLKQDDITNDFSAIRVAQLEDADRKKTVDLMVQKYTCRALKRTETILKEIDRNDLLQCLPTTSSKPKDPKTRYCGPEKEHHQKNLQSIQQFEVEVTLDPETAHPNLILSEDGKRVHHGDVRQNLPNNPERFHKCVNVLGKQGFTRGKFYFQVQVKGKTAWALGVARESIKRKGNITANPRSGYWTIMLTDEDEYQANEDDQVCLSLKSQPEKVGVFVEYEEGQVSFYDVDSSDHLYSFTGCSFTEKLFPFFTPFTNDDGRNSAPLVISPVGQTPNIRTRLSVSKEDYGIKKAELQSIQQFEMEVTLDPETAHPALILSEDGKRVHATDVKQKLPYNPKRFNACVNVLGKQSISSGKFYYEVQVKGKTAWAVGVASESISRKDRITLGPENGFWTVGLGANDEYTANDHPAVPLSLKSPPEKVGVFVDYEEGLVSFYNSDTADRLYSFTRFRFTENLLPFFSPCTNDRGKNSAPLIICRQTH